MYKIYINETPLYLTSVQDAQQFGPPNEKILILRYAGKKKFLLNVVNQLENADRFDRIVVFHTDLEEMWTTFQKIFKLIEAAGGVVFNDKQEVLMIHRRGYWDLPKGKIDPGETPEAASVREVEEETGASSLKRGELLCITWHTFQKKGKRVLKKTYWYQMETSQKELTPQAEEDIELAVWKNLQEYLAKPGTVYGSILDVLQKVAKTNE